MFRKCRINSCEKAAVASWHEEDHEIVLWYCAEHYDEIVRHFRWLAETNYGDMGDWAVDTLRENNA